MKNGDRKSAKIATTESTNTSDLVVVGKIIEDIEQNRKPAERYEEPIPAFFMIKSCLSERMRRIRQSHS
ncbi:hypothetical protein SNF32_00920 [Enterococcus mundtii]|nr:hypothetical protein [Enterococcus mundtii]